MAEAKDAYLRIKVGDRYSFSKTVTEADIVAFAGITGDFNPLHIDEVSAGKTQFKGRIAHGMLTAGFISATLSNLPGIVLYISQTLHFRLPVRIGDTITAISEVIEKRDRKNEILLSTVCKNQDDE
ncbi:MAG TPA: MaoC family dehydratase, partial [Candidatus Syntrophoarchaeum butanivorans]|nr:MaoC family dehydratase [Candidatus Syntrophoarchaeum butanivorans]